MNIKETENVVSRFSVLSATQQSEFLAEIKKKAVSRKRTSHIDLISAVSRDQMLSGVPLSYSQQRLWFISQLGEIDNASYNIPAAISIKGNLNIDHVRRAFKNIISRHDILRSRIVVRDGQPLQVIEPVIDFKLSVTLVSEEDMQDTLQYHASIPFNLSEVGLFRAGIFKVSEYHHILFINMHHIISDGWSLDIIKKEFIHYYQSEDQLPQLEVQYQDFANWQRNTDQDDIFSKDLQYWEDTLIGIPDYFALPTFNKRPAVVSGKGLIYCDSLPADVLHTVEDFSRYNQVSTFVTLMSAFSVLLGRYTNQSDISVGTAVANRHHKQIERNIGFFVNTLVIRSQVKSTSSFVELLHDINNAVRTAYEHQKLPFERVVEHLKPVRSTSHAPLFQVMLVYQDFPSATSMNIEGLTIAELPCSSGTSKFDLMLILQRETMGFSLRVEYRSDLFDEEYVVRFVEHYKLLLAKLCSAPHTEISSFPILTVNEHRQLSGFQGKRNYSYQTNSIEAIIRENANRHPNSIAVKNGVSVLTYGQLYNDALVIAEQLNRLRLAPDQLVAIVVNSGLQQISAVLGALISGSAYVPISAAIPLQRQLKLLEISGAKVVLTEFGKSFGELQCIELGKFGDCSEYFFDKPRKPLNELGCVVFESVDQQEVPKGISISQSNIINAILDINEKFSTTSKDTILAISEFESDHSIYERFSILVAGGSLVVFDDDQLDMPAIWIKALNTLNVTTLHSSPMRMEVLLNYVQRENRNKEDSLRRVCLAAQQTKTRLLERIVEWNPSLEISIFEGLPEVARWSVMRCFTTNMSNSYQRVLSNHEVHVLNQAFEACPILVSGEIYHSGIGLATSYWQHDGAAEQRFIVHPKTGKRLFCSGDVGRWLPNGQLEILKYNDQRKSFNDRYVSLAEITSTLKSHMYVSDARVEVAYCESLGEVLVANVETSTTLSKSDLYRYLHKLLPYHMIPRHYDICSMLKTKNANEHIEQSLSSMRVTRRYIAPRTPLEFQITQIWCRILGLVKVGINDSFIELGGTSVQAIQVVSEINNSLNVDIAVKDLFNYVTIAGLADTLNLVL